MSSAGARGRGGDRLRCTLGQELLPTQYVDRKGRSKVVRYWEMAVTGSRPFEANNEIDEVAWLSVEKALDWLSYPHDAEVVANVRLPFISGSPSSG